jgi:hypothetical protein
MNIMDYSTKKMELNLNGKEITGPDEQMRIIIDPQHGNMSEMDIYFHGCDEVVKFFVCCCTHCLPKFELVRELREKNQIKKEGES